MMQMNRSIPIKHSNRGFTLIELLVTISIIAVLSAIGLVTFSAVLKQGRDSKRQSDLRSIQSALELYFADQFYYPAVGNSCSNGTLKFGCILKDPAGNKTYINTVPADPTGSPQPQYLYSPVTSSGSGCDNSSKAMYCTTYCLFAKLENSNSGTGSCTDSTGKYNFAITPP